VQNRLILSLRGVHDAVLELYGLAIDRKDEELQKALKKLVLAMLTSRHRILNHLTVPMLALAMMSNRDRYQNPEDAHALVLKVAHRLEVP
jgi:hypothetical protein